VASRVTPVTIGCCGFALAQTEYYRQFSCTEIDTSFYNLPRLETAERWRQAAPEDFQFALKAWQVITHPSASPTYERTRLDPRDREHCGGFRWNATTRWAWDQTWQVAKTLDAFLVLFQCPTSFRPTKENIVNLRTFFERAKRGRFHCGWEPRGEWPAELVAQLCAELDLVHVVHPLQQLPAARAKLRYFRLHGLPNRQARFSAEQLEKLREICRAERTPAYCFFNNLGMAADARRFAALMR
jgi:uncharacterized protein YecE (DUF72 family)